MLPSLAHHRLLPSRLLRRMTIPAFYEALAVLPRLLIPPTHQSSVLRGFSDGALHFELCREAAYHPRIPPKDSTLHVQLV